MKTLLIISTIGALLFSHCKKNSLCTDDNLSLQKTIYAGNQLKIDGYFYGDINPNGSLPFANIYYFFSNGVFFTSEAADLDKAETGTIKIDVGNSSGKQIKGLWGVFIINGTSIEIERWQSNINGCETTIYEKGDILNDTTFIITRREFREKGKSIKTETRSSTFYFKALTQKPDSTNKFIP